MANEDINDHVNQWHGLADARQGGVVGQSFVSRQAMSDNAVKVTAVGDAMETFSAAHRLSDRVIGVVNRIAGHAPPQDCPKSGSAPVANGILDEIRDGARSAHNAILRADEAIDRLERELP